MSHIRDIAAALGDIPAFRWSSADPDPDYVVIGVRYEDTPRAAAALGLPSPSDLYAGHDDVMYPALISAGTRGACKIKLLGDTGGEMRPATPLREQLGERSA